VLLKAGANVDAKNNYGTTPARNAILNKFGNEKMLKVLLEHGANPNDIDNTNISICHEAAAQEKLIKFLEILIKFNANINICVPVDGTPCHKAVYMGNFKALTLLLAAGADLSIIDTIGETVHDVSKKMGKEHAFNTACSKEVIEETGFNAIHERITQICFDLRELDIDDNQMCELVMDECKPFTDYLDALYVLNLIENVRNAMKKS
jgi:ankyrin repeat protein